MLAYIKICRCIKLTKNIEYTPTTHTANLVSMYKFMIELFFIRNDAYLSKAITAGSSYERVAKVKGK